MKRKLAVCVLAAAVAFTSAPTGLLTTYAEEAEETTEVSAEGEAPGGGAGSAGQEFGTFDELKSYADTTVLDGVVSTDLQEGVVTTGTVGETSADGINIKMLDAESTGNGIAISMADNEDVYTISNSSIEVSAGDTNNTLGYEAACGVGVGVETGQLRVENSTISSTGARSTPIYMMSTSGDGATSLVVENSTLTSSGDVWMPSFKLLMGGARATLLMTRDNSWFYDATVTSENWGAISQDSVDAYTYTINTTAESTDGGYASYLTYGLRSYGSEWYAGQYGLFMCGNTDVLTDNGSAAGSDTTAMSQVGDYNLSVENTDTVVVAPFNALVVHNSLSDTSMTSVGVFKNTTLSTLAEDLPDTVTAISYADEFFLTGPNPNGTNGACGAAYFFNKNLYGSIALVRSMNADFTFDNATLKSSNGVLVQSVITYDPPQAQGYLSVGEGESVPGVTATFENGEYDGDILHEDYQRGMTLTVGENATLTGKVVSGTYAAWNALWSEENLEVALADDGLSSDMFDNESWVSDVQANLILSEDEAYEGTDNIGVTMTVANGGTWVVDEDSSLASLKIEEGATVTAPEGYEFRVYTGCDDSNSNEFYSTEGATFVSELTAGTYEDVVIVVSKKAETTEQNPDTPAATIPATPATAPATQETTAPDTQETTTPAAEGATTPAETTPATPATTAATSATTTQSATVTSAKTDATTTVGTTFTKGKLTYEVTSDTTVKVVGVSGKKLTNVTIPATVKGYKVTAIGKNAFKGCTKLKKITVKSSAITSVSKSAFKNCKSLKKIVLAKKNYKKIKKLFKKAVASNVKITK